MSKPNYKKCARLYNFCRYVDDVVDKKIGNYSSVINQIESDLKCNKKLTNNNVKSINLLISSKEIRTENLLELIHGIKLDTNLKFINTKKELINYCYHVAGTVGVMLCNIFGIDSRQSYKFAVDLGIAMQLTNIARDILEDAHIGRIYIPKEWLAIGCLNIKLPNKKDKIKIKKASKKILDLSEKYYNSSLKGLGFLPIRTRFAILLALITYREIGLKIKRMNYSNIYKRERINFTGKIRCFIKCIFCFFFNSHIHRKDLLHDSILHKDLSKNMLTNL